MFKDNTFYYIFLKTTHTQDNILSNTTSSLQFFQDVSVSTKSQEAKEDGHRMQQAPGFCCHFNRSKFYDPTKPTQLSQNFGSSLCIETKKKTGRLSGRFTFGGSPAGSNGPATRTRHRPEQIPTTTRHPLFYIYLKKKPGWDVKMLDKKM